MYFGTRFLLLLDYTGPSSGEIGPAFKTWENTELQRNRASDSPPIVVSLYLENSTVYFKEQILQLSFSSGPTAYNTCSLGCSNLAGQPQIKHCMSGQPGLGLFLELVLPAV